MWFVQGGATSAEVAAGNKLLMQLWERGLGLNEAIDGLAPLARAMWDLVREDYNEYRARLSIDSSVEVFCEVGGPTDFERHHLTFEIQSSGKFRITISVEGDEDGEMIDFSLQDPLVAFEAQDVVALERFLVLVPIIGGELELVDDDDDDDDDDADDEG
jgi:hypothetical protein